MQKIALAKVLGYLDGDGSISPRLTNRVVFSNANFNLIKDYIHNFEEVFGITPGIWEGKTPKLKLPFYYARTRRKNVCDFLLAHPREFETNEEKSAYLQGLCDSEVSIGKRVIDLCMKNNLLINRAKSFFSSLGIKSKYTTKKKGNLRYPRLLITHRNNIRKFAKMVPLVSTHKQHRIDNYLKRVGGY